MNEFSSFLQLSLFISKHQALEHYRSEAALGARRGRAFQHREDFCDSNERKSRVKYDEILFPIV